MKPIVPTCIVLHLLLWCSVTRAQSVKVTHAKTPAAYSCMFSIGIGIDIPSLNNEQGYYAVEDDDLDGNDVPNLWRNAYTKDFHPFTRMIGVSYYPADRWDIAVWTGHQPGDEEGISSLTWSHARINANYRPGLGFCRRIRPAFGLQFSWDKFDYWGHYFDDTYYEQASTSLTVGVLTGLRLATGRVLWGVDLTTLLLSNSSGTYYIYNGPISNGPNGSSYELSGDFEHTLGLPEALEDGYAFGHVALHCSYTIIER